MRSRTVLVGAVTLVLVLVAWWLLPTFKRVPPSPALRAFGDQRHWVLAEPMTWRIGDTDLSITVPRGFVTDMASVPQPMWSLGLTPTGRYGRAAIVHDYLYWAQGCTRSQSDRLMLKAMQESGVDAATIDTIHAGLSLGGGPAWTANARARAAGAFRVLPEGLDRPEDPNQDWPAYRDSLADRAIHDPPLPVDPRVCSAADGIAVPATAPTDPTGRMPGG